MTQQTAISCTQMRGGSSKGLFFLADDLPRNAELRDRVLVAAMGADARQIDGLGGADPLTSKVAIVRRSNRADADVDYLFAQVLVGKGRVDTSPNCGNILAAVGPFAIERGLIATENGETVVRVYLMNSDSHCELVVQTPGGVVEYEGDACVDGVPGTSAPILCNYKGITGSSCGSLLPTGNRVDEIDGVVVTCIDNGMPVLVLRASDFGRTGYESRDELNQDEELKSRLESIRLQAGPMMNLGDVSDKVFPKMSLIAAPQFGGHVCTRTFIPKTCHAAIGALGAVSVATACIIDGSVTDGIAVVPNVLTEPISVEHPSGEFSVRLEVEVANGRMDVKRAGLLRTARLLFRGEVFVPASIWSRSDD